MQRDETVIVKEGTVESVVNGTLQRVGPGSVSFSPDVVRPT